MSLSVKIEGLLAESKIASIGAQIKSMSAEQIVSLIDRRAPEDDEFSLSDIFTDDEIEDLASNPNLQDLKALSPIIHRAVMDLLDDSTDESLDGGDDDDDDEDDDDETLDAPEANEGAAQDDIKRHEAFFANYKRPTDVSAKIKKDAKYDIAALISRRVKPLPDNVPFNLSNILSIKELDAIMRHPTFDRLDAVLRDDLIGAIDEHLESIGDEIDTTLVMAATTDGVLKESDAAYAAYLAGMASKEADGSYKINGLGERHAVSVAYKRLAESGQFVLEDAIAESTAGVENTDAMSDIIRDIAKKKIASR
jgi:hypothetical protein